MASPPWAEASSHEQYFVLLTGANSGVGLGIGQRIIDEFLAERSLSSHLILIPTTRSVNKSRETILALRAHLRKTAYTSKQLRARAGPDYDPRTAIDRVHILSVQLDLCNLRSVYAAADQLVHGKLSDLTGLIDDVRIPRIDAAILNAGIGGWEGINWLEFAKQFLSVGLVQCTSFPSFKIALPAAVLDQQKLIGEKAARPGAAPPPELAEVFCANVFGHYILAHELMPLLSRPQSPEFPDPGRVIWTSSVDTGREHFDYDDFQATRRNPPYESSKRITDYLALTVDLPSVRPVAAPYFSAPSSHSENTASKRNPPRFYLSHPGIVCTPIFPLNWLLFYGYYLAMLLSRWAGSPWHTVTPYAGARASSWLALANAETLAAANAEHAKWGSACARTGPPAPKRTEVDGWGWEGRVEDPARDSGDREEGILAKARGRRWCADTMTEEKRARFEEDGRKCWAELERLRLAWEEALGRGGSA